MRPIFILLVSGSLALLAASPSRAAEAPAPAATETAAESAARVRPLLPGSALPAVTLRDPDGNPVDLPRAFAGKPAVLVFYRGGWCPFCTRQLAGLGAILPDLAALGVSLHAVSPDSPETLKTFVAKGSTEAHLLSDADMTLARACGIAFRVDEATRAKYKGFGIDLQAASGRDHFELPVPAVFLVGADGKILLAHADPDYKVRLAPEVILAAARFMTGRETIGK